MTEKQNTTEKQLVVFNLDSEEYALDIVLIREIIQMQPIIRVPGTPESVIGVINLRGSVIPVINLRKQLQLNNIAANKDSRIIVVNCKKQAVGIIVDSVSKVTRIHTDAIESSNDIFASCNRTNIHGIVKMQDRLIILLDIDNIVSNQDIAAINSLELKNNQVGKKTTATV